MQVNQYALQSFNGQYFHKTHFFQNLIIHLNAQNNAICHYMALYMRNGQKSGGSAFRNKREARIPRTLI